MIRHIDVPTAISDTLEFWGSDEAQRNDAVLVLAKDCTKQGDEVLFRFPDKTTARIDSADVKAWIEKNKGHLLPRKFETSLADQAFLGKGNATAMQRLCSEVGIEQAHKIARTYRKKNAFDRITEGVAPTGDDDSGDKAVKPKGDKAKNPWLDDTAAGEARRVSVIKSLGTKVAAGLAMAAGKDIGGRPLRNRVA